MNLNMKPGFYLAAYYGPGGRAGGRGRAGELEGDLAIEVRHASAAARDMEADLARGRSDIGVVNTWEVSA